MKEVVAALRLIGLTDLGRRPSKPIEGTEEPTVGLVPPPDVARPAPAAGSQGVETAVISDAVARVRLDGVATEVAEGGPRCEIPRVGRHDRRHGSAVVTRVREFGLTAGIGGREDGLGKTTTEVHRRVGHLGMLAHGMLVGVPANDIPDPPCVFCSIVAGTTPAEVVLDEDDVIAFLDVRPVFPGHVLVAPKHHHVTLVDLPTLELPVVFGAAQRVAAAVVDGLGADGSFVAMNNVVSQSVPHLHVHVVPRRRKDGLRGFFWPRVSYASPDEMADYARRIAAALASRTE